MEERLLSKEYRKQIIAEIKGDENIQRKVVSYKKMRMQQDDFWHYVKEELERKLQKETVDEMHIFANINLQKRVSRSEAAIYKKSPERIFYENDNELDTFQEIYKDMKVDTCLKKANVAYKYLNQCSIQVYPSMGKLCTRLLLPHHYDVIPYADNPEKAMCYVISNFDNTIRDKVIQEGKYKGHSQGQLYRNMNNENIGDADDQKLKEERYYFYSESFNFVCNGKGNILNKEDETIEYEDDFINENGSPILDENILSPLFEYNCLPFIDVADDKSFEFWVRGDEALFDATIMYNTIVTKEFQVVELQGHSQAVYKGNANHMPEQLRVGADKVIFIPEDPENPTNSSFEFVNPNSDLGNIREFRESFLASFLSSRGLDTSLVSGKSGMNVKSSGVEKLLDMIDKFDASQEDFALFESVEKQLFKIVCAWVKSLYGERVNGELILDDEYQINISDPMNTSMKVEYKKPELIKSEKEVLEITEKEIDMGVSSRVHYLMEQKGMTKEQAIERLKEIEEYEAMDMGDDETNDQERSDQADI